MAEISASKGRDTVVRIEGTSQQSGGLARPQPQASPPAQSGERRRQGEEAEEVLVEIGEEARHNLEQEQTGEAASGQGETDTEEKQEQGAIVDVVV